MVAKFALPIFAVLVATQVLPSAGSPYLCPACPLPPACPPPACPPPACPPPVYSPPPTYLPPSACPPDVTAPVVLPALPPSPPIVVQSSPLSIPLALPSVIPLGNICACKKLLIKPSLLAGPKPCPVNWPAWPPIQIPPPACPCACP